MRERLPSAHHEPALVLGALRSEAPPPGRLCKAGTSHIRPAGAQGQHPAKAPQSEGESAHPSGVNEKPRNHKGGLAAARFRDKQRGELGCVRTCHCLWVAAQLRNLEQVTGRKTTLTTNDRKTWSCTKAGKKKKKNNEKQSIGSIHILVMKRHVS